MKQIMRFTLFAIVSFTLPSLSCALAQTASPRPNPTTDFFKRGVVRYQQRDLEEAMRNFDQAVDIASTISSGAYVSNLIGVRKRGSSPLSFQGEKYEKGHYPGSSCVATTALHLCRANIWQLVRRWSRSVGENQARGHLQ